MFPLVLAALPAVVALVLWSILELEWFVLLVVLGAMMVPASLAKPAGANIAGVDILLLVAGASWLINNSLGRAPDPLIRTNPFIIPALIFVGVSAASLIWSVKPRSTLIYTIQLIEITIVFPLVFASLPRSVRSIRKGFLLFIALTCVLAMVAIVYFVTHASARQQGTYLTGWNKNALGSFVAAGAVLAYTLRMGVERARDKVLLALAFFIEIGGVIVSVSRGALIGAAVAILVVSLLLRRERIVTLTVTAALVVVWMAYLAPIGADTSQTQGAYDSSVVRGYAWDDAIKRIETGPLLGTGGKTYVDNVSHLNGVTITDPDNMILLTWTELGLAGVAALLFMLTRFGQILVRVRRLKHDAAVLAVGAGGVTLSLFVHFQVDVTWTRGTTSLAFAMIGVMIALMRLDGTSDASPVNRMGVPAVAKAHPPEGHRQWQSGRRRTPMPSVREAEAHPVRPVGRRHT